MKNPLASVREFFRLAGLHPETLALCLCDGMKINASPPGRNPEDCLSASARWLLEAFERTGRKGVSVRYDLRARRWASGYRETTGYIIPTLIQYSAFTGDSRYADAAVEMARWLCSEQRADGSIDGEPAERTGPMVFDTGQVLNGLTAVFEYTHELSFRDAAVRAAQWLMAVQEPDGSWVRFSYHQVPHAYYARVAYALAECGVALGRGEFVDAARRFYDRLLAWQLPNGYFDHLGFLPDETVWTHTIAYTLEGMIRGANFVRQPALIEAAAKPARVMLRQFELKKTLPGGLDREWKSSEEACCLTGLAQMAVVWFLLGRATGDLQFTSSAFKACDFLSTRQEPISAPAGRAGALAGSFPLYRGYQSMSYPNWAQKFFMDACLLYAQERDRLLGAGNAPARPSP